MVKSYFLNWEGCYKTSRIKSTINLLTCNDSSTNTNGTEMDRNEPKLIETDRNKQKQTDMDRYGQIRTETDRNRQKH